MPTQTHTHTFRHGFIATDNETHLHNNVMIQSREFITAFILKGQYYHDQISIRMNSVTENNTSRARAGLENRAIRSFYRGCCINNEPLSAL